MDCLYHPRICSVLRSKICLENINRPFYSSTIAPSHSDISDFLISKYFHPFSLSRSSSPLIFAIPRLRFFILTPGNTPVSFLGCAKTIGMARIMYFIKSEAELIKSCTYLFVRLSFSETYNSGYARKIY